MKCNIKIMLKKIAYIILYPEYRIMYLVNKYIRSVDKQTKKDKIVRLLLRSVLMTRYNLIIGLNAKIGEGLKMHHPMNIVVGDGLVIGDNFALYYRVILGQNKGNLNIKNLYKEI
ncbi:hypothetical protein IO44_01405 [Gallibacterium anatis str. Avicor]|nr:hypothetical protein IO44_01405 [Gallibacterium anatis str. Avicor]